jgi:hypothetical protein
MPKAAKKVTKKRDSSASKKKAERKQRNDYVELSKASHVDGSPVSFYATVLDATFPYKTNNNKYVCSMKITDPSIASGKKDSWAQLVLYARRFEDLPIVQRIGDVIRVHRSILRLHNGKKQFNASIYFNSSWALFSSDKRAPDNEEKGENEPFAHNGKNYSFEKNEKDVLSKIRKFSQTHFGSNNVLSSDMHVALSKANTQKHDFDVLAKILQIFEKDEFTNELKIRDGSNKTWYVLALKLKFPHLAVGDVIRIRSSIYDETSKKNVLNLSHYSNIMTFISHSKLAKEVRNKVSDDKKSDAAALKETVSMHPVMLTEVDKKHANLAITPLKDLFSDDADIAKNTTFRTHFCVSKVEPANVQEYCKFHDKKANKTTSTKGGKGTNPIFQVQFLVKGGSSSNSHYRVLLYTHDGLGKDFFGVAAQDLHKNNAVCKKLEDHTAHLTKFNSWVDAVVERRNGYYFIKDTKMAM